MTIEVRLAVDAMSGDFGLAVTIPAVYQALKRNDSLIVLLFGPAKELMLRTAHFSKELLSRTIICNASDVVQMTDSPEQAMQKTASSLMLALDAVLAGRADAIVTASPTGALIRLCEVMIDKCAGVTRAALISEIPSPQKRTFMLDLGAHLQLEARELVEFAHMGHYCAGVITGVRYPKIALLNVGDEDGKGTEAVKTAHEFLKSSTLNYRGFVEGYAVFDSEVDVVVCDGWVGNIAMKTAEGAANTIVQRIMDKLTASALNKSLSAPALPLLYGLRTELDPNRYNGAILVGFAKNIIKSHSSSKAAGFANAIDIAMKTITFHLPDKISQGFEHLKLGDKLDALPSMPLVDYRKLYASGG